MAKVDKVKLDVKKTKPTIKALKLSKVLEKPTDKEVIENLKSQVDNLKQDLNKTTNLLIETTKTLYVVPSWIVSFFKFFR